MPTPFGAETWVRRTSVPNIPLNGVYSGLVQGPISAVYDRESRLIQTFSRVAHHFQGFASTAQASTDDGASWATTFNEGLNNTVVFTGWSVPDPSGVGRLHFQVRYKWTKAVFVFDGSIVEPGGIDLYGSSDGVSYSFVQNLHSWPAINQIGGNGGAPQFNITPSCSNPILIEGSGPGGLDAYWMASSFSFEAGGAGNRTTFKAATLWRSLNGIDWEAVRDLEPVLGVINFSQFFRSTTGRLFLAGSTSASFTDEPEDLINAAFTGSTGLVSPRSDLIAMYGGTLLTHKQGSLVSGGDAYISCDDGETFNSTGVLVVPVNQTGFLAKLGPTEALIVAPGFSDPSTETVSYYTSDGGETFVASEPWLVSSSGESPVMLAIREDGTPIVVTRAGGVFVSSDKARGVAGTRTICPLANAGLASARRLILCGGVITPDCQE